MTQRIFISHAHSDAPAAAELCACLEASPAVRCWLAPRDVRPSAEWAAEIMRGIRAADLMVLLLSAASNASAHVRREVERADHWRVPLLVVRIEPVSPAPALEYFVGHQQWLEACAIPLAQVVEPIQQILSGLPAAPERTRARTPTTCWAPATLARIQALLAEQLGPVAAVLVRQAAAQAASGGALAETLAAEIRDVAARERFILVCRRALSHAQPGAAPCEANASE